MIPLLSASADRLRVHVREITSGLPGDSREEAEREEERRPGDLRGWVKGARAAVATTLGLAEILAGGWRKAAGFYGRFGLTQEQFRGGVPLTGGAD